MVIRSRATIIASGHGVRSSNCWAAAKPSRSENRPTATQIRLVVAAGRARRRCDQHAVHLMFEEALERSLGARALLIGVGQDQAIAGLGEHGLRTAHYGGPEVALDTRNDQADRRGAT